MCEIIEKFAATSLVYINHTSEVLISLRLINYEIALE